MILQAGIVLMPKYGKVFVRFCVKVEKMSRYIVPFGMKNFSEKCLILCRDQEIVA